MRIQALAGAEPSDDDGMPIALQRQVWRLALFLATRPSRTATIDEIIDALWPVDPPPSARPTVHVLVNRLRGAAGAAIIERTARGYRIDADLDTDAVLAAFDRSAALERDDVAGALVELEAALAMGGGEPFGGFADERWLVDTVAQFVERRRQEEERWAALRIRVGTAADVVERLELATRKEPLREIRWEQLMLVLYRAGRQADALRAYEGARAHLSDALGVEPGLALRRLHRAILDHDVPPDGLIAPPIGPAHRWEPLVGRQVELDRLEQLARRHRLITITGIGGVGKSRLADEFAYRRLLAGARTQALTVLADRSVDDLARALVVAGRRGALEPDVGLLEVAVLHGQTLDLLVVDAAERSADAVLTLADHLVEHCPRLTVLVTSRRPLDAAGEVVVPLDGLDTTAGVDADAFRLFAERLGIDVADASADDHERFRATVARTGGIPMLLELAAATFDADDDASGPPPGGEPYSVREAIHDALDLIEPDAVALLEALAVMPVGLGVDTVARWVDDERVARRLLRQLRSVRLVVAAAGSAGRRYRVLDPIADEIAAGLAADHVAAVDARAVAVLGPMFREFRPVEGGPLHLDRLPHLDDEADNVRAVVERLVARRRSADAIALAVDVGQYWWQRARVDETYRLLASATAEPGLDVVAEARALRVLADVASDTWRMATLRDRFESVLDRARGSAIDSRTLATIIGWVVVGRGFAGDLAGADALITEGASLVAGDPWLEARHGILLALRAVADGDHDRAVAGLRACAVSLAEVGDVVAAGTTCYVAAMVGDLFESPETMDDVERARQYAARSGSDRIHPRLDFIEASVRARQVDDDVEPLLELGDRLEEGGCLRQAAVVRRNAGLALLQRDPVRATGILVRAIDRLLLHDRAAAAVGLAGLVHVLHRTPVRSALGDTAAVWWRESAVPVSAVDRHRWEELAPAGASRGRVLSVDEVRDALRSL